MGCLVVASALLRRSRALLTRRRPSFALPRRTALRVEGLEERVVLDTVTFAQFVHVGGSPQLFAYTNNGGTSADFGTLPGGDAILLSFDPRFAPALTTPRNAHLFLTSHTTEPTSPVLVPDNVTREHFPTVTNTLQILLDTPVNGKTNFLTVTYSDLLGGIVGSHEASQKASDASSGSPPDTVTFTSDFIDFTGTINHGFALSFSSVDSTDGSGGLQVGAGGFFKSFTAAATGTFDTNFAGQISGRKFEDSNGNGQEDAGEPGLAGWHIFLDGNGVHRETVTDANGSYAFADVEPGTYQVSEESRPGWVQTTVSPGRTTVVSGANITGMDFGNFQLGSVAGQKFQDTNGNGQRDANEPTLAGWTVVLDAVGGSLHETTVTDATGSYRFSNLPIGTYRVREEGQPGWVQTTVNPGDVSVVRSGSVTTGVDFGNFQLGGIAGQKFQDTNGNGQRDANEPVLAGWTVVLDAVGGNLHETAVTDATGSYHFTNLPAGTYRIREVGQPGWVQTTVNPGDVTVVSGTNRTGVDFGNFQLGGIAGQKFQDSNGNGQRDANEPVLAGWTIMLDAVGGSLHETTVTDATGSYHFSNLPPGVYRVREVGQTGWVQTTVNPGDVTMVSGANVAGIDFGNFQLGSIAGQKFDDLNGNGSREPNEPTLAGWTIVLDAVNGSLHLSTVTDASGSYHFSSLPPGTYRIREVGQTGWMQTTVNPADLTLVSGATITGIDFGNEMPGGSAILPPTVPPTVPVTLPPNLVSKLELFAGNLQGIQNGLLNNDSAFIGMLYQDVLNRPVDPDGLSHWLQLLLAGMSRLDVATAIWQSAEHRSLEVNQYYADFLGRNADAAGRNSWVQAFQNGADEAAVIGDFLTSSEYQAAHASAASFVNALYTQLLGRSADASGMAGWVQALQNGLSRRALAQSFLSSAEEDQKFVAEGYALFLNRAADARGEQTAVNALLQGGATFESVAEHILASDEYFARASRG